MNNQVEKQRKTINVLNWNNNWFAKNAQRKLLRSELKCATYRCDKAHRINLCNLCGNSIDGLNLCRGKMHLLLAIAKWAWLLLPLCWDFGRTKKCTFIQIQLVGFFVVDFVFLVRHIYFSSWIGNVYGTRLEWIALWSLKPHHCTFEANSSISGHGHK